MKAAFENCLVEVRIASAEDRNFFLIVPILPPGNVLSKVSGFNTMLLSLTRHEGSQAAVFTPLLKDHSIVTPKFLAKLGKWEDSKVSPTTAKSTKNSKQAILLLEVPSTEVEIHMGQQCRGVC